MRCSILVTVILLMSLLSFFSAGAQQIDSSSSSKMMPAILEGKLNGKFIHSWSGRGGDHGSTSTVTPVIDKDQIILPAGNWMIFVSSHINHINGQFQMNLDCDGELSESVYLNGRGINNQWESITLTNCFSGIKVHKGKPVQIVIKMNRAGTAGTATLGDIFHYVTAFKIKKAHKSFSR